MPLINRIEVANFMNAKRLDPWRADWPYSLFELKGDSTAINITNGRGKSTLVHLLIAMLAWDRRDLGELRKAHFAPAKTGRFTHVRVEMKVDVPAADLLVAAGGEIAGRTMVFGIHGNSGPDDKWLLYSYRGALEDCAIAHAVGAKVSFVANSEFLGRLDNAAGAFPASQREIGMKQWRDNVATWFDMASLEQQLQYQRCKAGEGSNTYFHTPELRGMSYSTSLFYERLAPELLRDVMGAEGEDDERGIEDTIHVNVSSVIRARRETEAHAQRLEKAEEVLREYARVEERANVAIAAVRAWEARRDQLSTELAVLKNLVVTAPIPGVPQRPGPELPEIAKLLVHQDERWHLPDRALGTLTGEEPGAVNQRAERKSLSPAKAVREQVLEITCDLKARDARGRPNRLYDRDQSLAWLSSVETFRGSWTAEHAIVAVRAVFDWAEKHADTNPARQRHREVRREIDRQNDAFKEMGERFDRHVSERERLRAEQRGIDLQQQAYAHMADSGLFTAYELAEPLRTGETAKIGRRAANDAVIQHAQKTSQLASVYEAWKDYRREYGERSPGNVADQLEAAIRDAEANERAAKQRRSEALAETERFRNLLRAAEKIARQAEQRATKVSELKPAALAFARLFPNEAPEGLADKVKQDLKAAQRTQQTLEQRKAALAQPLEDLAAFHAEYPDTEPAAWLIARNDRWSELGAERGAKSGELDDVRLRRSDLNVAAVAPGKVAREALQIAGGQPEALHVAVERMGLPSERREKVLSLFSALLFSPVYATLAEAAHAAAKFAAQEVEAPVFVYDELALFCHDGDIAYRDQVANTWLVGRRTRPVDCLLDPTLVEREKVELATQVAQLEARITEIDSERSQLSPDGEVSKLAHRAQDALEREVEAESARIDGALVALARETPRLSTRASDESFAAIGGILQWKGFLVGDTEEAVEAAHANARKAAQSAEEALNDHQAHVEALDQQVRDLGDATNNAKAAALAVKCLRAVQLFVEDPVYNPSFMNAAEERRQQLADAFSHADQRAGFSFDLAEAFAKGGEEKRRHTEQEIRRLSEEIKAITERRPKITELVGQLEEDAKKLALSMGRIDSFVRKLMDNYRNLAIALPNPIAKAATELEGNNLYDYAPGLRDANTSDELVQLMDDLLDDRTLTGSDSVDAELRNLLESHQRSVRDLHSAIDRIMEERKRLQLGDRDVLDLERAKSAPAGIARLYAVTKENYDKNVDANTTAREHLEHEWAQLGEWLQTFTRDLRRNFELMKDRFAPPRKPDKSYAGSGFEIEGSIAQIDDVRATLSDIVQMVEDEEALTSTSEDADRDLRTQRRNNLRHRIRIAFYSRVIVTPSIKVFMPSVSPKALPLQKNMLSSGQSIAMTLLWIVKMASYVTERDLRRNPVKGAQLKRLLAGRTTFVIIDGAFSHLSDRRLIDDALAGMGATRGSFQLVVTGHDPNYQNDYSRFPVYLIGRELGDDTMFVDEQSNTLLRPEAVGLYGGAMATQRMHALPDVLIALQ